MNNAKLVNVLQGGRYLIEIPGHLLKYNNEIFQSIAQLEIKLQNGQFYTDMETFNELHEIFHYFTVMQKNQHESLFLPLLE